MEIKVWYLSTCSTCRRILQEVDLNDSNAELINIKTTPLTEIELEDMKSFTGSYRDLINGRSAQFRSMDKKAKDLTEEEARELLLKHYAFLKRPVVRINDDYFIGNSKRNVQALQERLDRQ